MPIFWLQIVDTDGRVATLPGGGKLEQDLIASMTNAIVAKGVGFFKTEASVRVAIAAGITDTINEIKQKTIAVR